MIEISYQPLIPAEAGIQSLPDNVRFLCHLDSRFRGNERSLG
jgi:hypothetical protein